MRTFPGFPDDLDEQYWLMHALAVSMIFQTDMQYHIQWLHSERGHETLQHRHLEEKSKVIDNHLDLWKEYFNCNSIPSLIVGTIFDSFRFVTAGKAMIGFPLPSYPSAAPRMKSTCPPKPEYIRVPIESEQTCPVRSTSIAELMAVIFGFCAMTGIAFTYAISSISVKERKSFFKTGMIKSKWIKRTNEWIVVNKVVQFFGSD